VIDLMPAGWGREDKTRWPQRQAEMTDAYAELAGDREHSLLAWRSDYGPLAEYLEPLAGRILDVGGGNGIARHWLSPAAEYVSLEPSTAWLDQPWSRLADVFPCLAAPPPTVRGVAERLPFREATFDGALSLWSLNHVSEPGRALAEIARGLRPGGRLVVVLEDMAPTWADLLRGRYPTSGGRDRLRAARRRLWASLRGWPQQSDHVPLRESAVLRDARPWLELGGRAWAGAYLLLDLRRRSS
jgi:SAM-dependent methyltransferase